MSSIYDELGVRPVINALGTATILGGNTPSPSVRALMDRSEEYYVAMDELMDAVGERIAAMLGVDAALVTSGAAAALTVAAAGCVTGTDPEKVARLPDTAGMRHEIIIQRQLRSRYDRCMTIPGGKLVEVGDVEETRPGQLEAAIGPDTAVIHCLAAADVTAGALPLEEVIRIGHANGIPIIVDAAASVYPTENLSKYVKMGADLVAYGAKYFGAVNSSGMLTGRADLIEAARMNSFISFETSASPTLALGRPMKMDRQEVIAVYAALREWLAMDHEKRFAVYRARISDLAAALRGVPHVELVETPQEGPPTGLRVKVDAEMAGKTGSDVARELRDGNPSIWVSLGEDGDHFNIGVPLLRDGNLHIISARLRDLLARPDSLL